MKVHVQQVCHVGWSRKIKSNSNAPLYFKMRYLRFFAFSYSNFRKKNRFMLLVMILYCMLFCFTWVCVKLQIVGLTTYISKIGVVFFSFDENILTDLSRFSSVMMASTLSRFCCFDMRAGSLKKAANTRVSSTVN